MHNLTQCFIWLCNIKDGCFSCIEKPLAYTCKPFKNFGVFFNGAIILILHTCLSDPVKSDPDKTPVENDPRKYQPSENSSVNSQPSEKMSIVI